VDNDCLTLYPNPTYGIFKIEGDLQNYFIEILDVNGFVNQNLTGATSPIIIDISSLPSGLYFIRFTNINDNKLAVQKILKVN